MAVYTKRNGQIIRLDGNKLGNSVDTTEYHLGNLLSLNEYRITTPTSDLRIDGFADTTSDLVKEYRITFKASANFVFTWNVSGKTYKFVDGEPIWNANETYTLIIAKGYDTDYVIYVIRG